MQTEFQKFEYKIENELRWRKKEISGLTLCLEEEKNSHAKEELGKSLVLFIYAHWEGFIKRSSKLYLTYISNLNIENSELTENFIAIVLKQNLKHCIKNNEGYSLNHELKVLEKLVEKLGVKFRERIDVENDQDNSIVNTHSNLNVEVLKSICEILGLSVYKYIEAEKQFIDRDLLSRRNRIGHGSSLNGIGSIEDLSIINKVDILKMRDLIFEIMDFYKEDILYYAENQFFKKENKMTCETYIRERLIETQERLSIIKNKYLDQDTN